MSKINLIIAILLFSSSAFAETYGGYSCSQDCSGHRAGYEWARENHIHSIVDCYDSKSRSFIEGCQLWLDGHERDSTRDDQGRFIPD